MDKLKTWLFQELELDIHLPFLKAGTFCFGVTQFHVPDEGKHGWRRLPLTHDSKWRFFVHLLLFPWFHSSQCQTRVCTIISLPLFQEHMNTFRKESCTFLFLTGSADLTPSFQGPPGRQTRALRWAFTGPVCAALWVEYMLIPESARLWALHMLPITRAH